MTSFAAVIFIVDKSDSNWRVSFCTEEWREFSQQIDIATACFEISSLVLRTD
jgi:hypothetical protein